jgi:hypothetical protein
VSHGRGLRGRTFRSAAGDPAGARVVYPSVPSETGSVLSASLPDGLLVDTNWTKSANPVIGNTYGGWSGAAQHSGVYVERIRDLRLVV